MVIGFGDHDLVTTPMDTHEQRLELEEIIVHPEYRLLSVRPGFLRQSRLLYTVMRNVLSFNLAENDIAILKVNTSEDKIFLDNSFSVRAIRANKPSYEHVFGSHRNFIIAICRFCIAQTRMKLYEYKSISDRPSFQSSSSVRRGLCIQRVYHHQIRATTLRSPGTRA